MTSNVELLPLPEPKFGDWLRGIHASETNPHRDGMYVRTIRRTGKLNPGVHYEVTDGNGKFWQYPAQSVERLATPPAAQPPAGEAAGYVHPVEFEEMKKEGGSIKLGDRSEAYGRTMPLCTAPPADALGAVRELVAKWRHQEPTCSALASQNRKDAFRRCANELEAALGQEKEKENE